MAFGNSDASIIEENRSKGYGFTDCPFYGNLHLEKTAFEELCFSGAVFVI